MKQINYLVLGLGVNLNMARDQLPEREFFPATSVMLEKGETVSREIFARNYFRLLDRLYIQYLDEGFPGIRLDWMSYCGVIGCRVELDTGEESLSGLVTGIDEVGALTFLDGNGHEKKVLSADIRSIHGKIHNSAKSQR
jgi:BirA family biotin operon repressor/biotin-[acetyl-CoA-carboxylase] ligase